MTALLDDARRDALRVLLARVEKIPGSVAEVGVYRGGSLKVIAEEVSNRRTIYGFDTFEGLPEAGVGEHHKKGDFADTSYMALKAIFKDRAILIKGLFPASAKESNLGHETFAFVHLDMDYGDGTKAALEWFYPRMSPGAILVTDDYGWEACPNIRPVFDEFAMVHGLKVESIAPKQAYFKK